MKFKKENAIIAVLILLSISIIGFSFYGPKFYPSPPTSGIPPSMEQFYGLVNYSNGTGVNGNIYARVNGIIEANNTIVNGKYGYSPAFIIENVAGSSLIEFYVNNTAMNVKVGEANFQSFALTKQDFIFSYCGDGSCTSSESCSSCSSDCGACNPGTPPGPGSGGPGGGGDIGPTCASKGYSCGNWTIGTVKLVCGTCTSGICNSTGKCSATETGPLASCTDTCSSLGKNCGTQSICNQQIDCGTCQTNQSCNNGICTNSIVQTPRKSYGWLIAGLIVLILAVLAVIAIVIFNVVKQRTLVLIITSAFIIIVIFFSLNNPNLLGNVISNPPSIHQFYGNIMKDGQVYDGKVEARIDGIVFTNVTSIEGRYGFDPLFIVQNGDGKLIEFFVDGNKAGEANFQSFGFTELNLAFSSNVVAPGSGGGSSGGGGGGGGSMVIISNNQTGEPDAAVVPSPEPANNSGNESQPARYKGLAGFAVLDDSGKGKWFGAIAVLALIVLVIVLILAGRKKTIVKD